MKLTNRKSKEKDRIRKKLSRQVNEARTNQKSQSKDAIPDHSVQKKCGQNSTDSNCALHHPYPGYVDLGHLIHDEYFHGFNPAEVLKGELPIAALDQYSQLMGLIPPSFLYAASLSSDPLPHNLVIKKSVFGVQIHYIENHYVVSHQKLNNIYVFDSLPNVNRVSQLLPQLLKLYEAVQCSEDSSSLIQYVVPQLQGQSPDCGLFAAANATLLIHDMKPEQTVLNQELLRQHMFKCLQSKCVTLFPANTSTQTSSGINKYLTEQIKLSQNLKRHQSLNPCKEWKIDGLQQNAKKYQVHQKLRPITESDDYLKTYRFLDKVRKKQKRQHRNEEIVKETRLINRERMKEARIATDENKAEQRRLMNRDCMRKKRAQRDENQIKANRLMIRDCMRKKRAQTDENQIKANRLMNRDCMRKKRAQTDENQIKGNRLMNRDCMRKKRAQRDENQIKANRLMNRDCMRKKRAQTDENQIKANRLMNRDCLRKKRAQTDEHQIKANRLMNRDCMRKKRAQTDEHQIKANRLMNRDCMRKKRAQTDEHQIKANRLMNRACMRKKRAQADEHQIKANRLMNRDCMRKKRAQTDEHQIKVNRLMNRDCMRKKRAQTDESRIKANRFMNRDCMRKKRKKADDQQRQQQRLNDTIRKKKIKKCRTLNKIKLDRRKDKQRKAVSVKLKACEQACQKFKQLAQCGPTYSCNVCHRLMFRNNVKVLSPDSYDKDIPSKLLNWAANNDSENWICTTCHRYLSKHHIPPQAVENRLWLAEQPPALANLSNLEARLVSQRYPFMKILALPSGRQKALYGIMVNVPVDVSETCTLLPRQPSETGFIPVKLKRKLVYQGHSAHELVRPAFVHSALDYLVKNNDLYHHVVTNTDWAKQFETADPVLWQGLTTPATTNEDNDTENITDHLPVDTKDSSDETDDEEQEENQVIYDTCMRRVDHVIQENECITLAPGEGRHPLRPHEDKDGEVLAFPQLFPNGKFGYDPNGDKRLTLKKYFNARLLNKDGRFSKNTEYLFYALAVSERQQLQANITTALRKCSGEMTAGDVKDRDNLKHIIHQDAGFNFLTSVRGSPAYCNQMLHDLFAMVKQLGVPTWFLTLSSAETKWPEVIKIVARQYGRILSEEDVENMSWEEKSLYIRSNPVTVARYFDYRVQTFFKEVILNSDILGEVTDYAIRTEFQMRGSPHIHCVLWEKNAPSLQSSDEELTNYIDRYISSDLPVDDSRLRELVLGRQKHVHGRGCRRSGKKCRAGFPRPPTDTTVICRSQTSSSMSTDKCYNIPCKEILSKVWEFLQDENTDLTDTSLKEILQQAGFDNKSYIIALQNSKKCNAVVLKRNVSCLNINNYNPNILKYWQANMDLQYIVDAYACIMYICSYITKAEKNMSNLLKAISKEANHTDTRKQLQLLGNTFLNHREISAQEASYHLLSLPLRKFSRTILFLSSNMPEKRVRLLKPRLELDKMENDDTDIYQTSLLDRYSSRPSSLSKMCFVEFAMQYTTSVDTKEDTEPTETFLPNVIQLQNGLGTMKVRRRRAIIRTFTPSVETMPNEHYYSKLILYYPWRSENDLQGEPLYQDKYNQVASIIEENEKHLQPSAHEVHKAAELLEDSGPPEDVWDEIASNIRHQEATDRLRGVSEDPEHFFITPHESIQFTEKSRFHISREPNMMSSEDIRKHIRTLNHTQYNIFLEVLQWAVKLSQSRKTTKMPSPLNLFISGAAGTGKSHLIRAIYHTVTKILRFEGDNPEDPIVLLTAPTGTAAFNVDGTTIHSAFALRKFQQGSKSIQEYYPLGADRLNSLRCSLANTQLLVIDEISMVNADLFFTIHRRLNEIKGLQDAIFGNISVICFGDLGQLPPIGRSIYHTPSNPYARLYGSLWQKYFKVVELTEIMRQQNDKTFAELLNNIRLNKMTEEDHRLLRTRSTSTTASDYPSTALHVFRTNKQTNDHNESQLKALGSPIVTCDAVISATDTTTDKVEVNVPDNPTITSGLRKQLLFCLDARVMLIKNVDIPDGLVNGAQGVITGFLPPPSNQPHYKPTFVLVKFDNTKVGNLYRQHHPQLQTEYPGSVAISKYEARFTINSSKTVESSILQFPLTLCWGCTIHKVQGATLSKIVVCLDKKFQSGQAYTALSRVTSLQNLYLLNIDQLQVTANKTFQIEMSRLLQNPYVFTDVRPSVNRNTLLVSLLNIESLPAHISDLRYCALKSSVILLTETWLNSNNQKDVTLPGYIMYKQDRENSYSADFLKTTGPVFPKHGGVAVYVQESFSSSRLSIPQGIECLCLTISSMGLTIAVIYRPPSMPNAAFLPPLGKLLNHLGNRPTIIAGDFNICDPDDRDPTVHQLNRHGYTQLVHVPTFRTGSCLDLIFSNTDRVIQISTLPCFFSQHDFVNATLQL